MRSTSSPGALVSVQPSLIFELGQGLPGWSTFQGATTLSIMGLVMTLSITVLSVIMLSVIMLNVVRLNFIMLSVVAPF